MGGKVGGAENCEVMEGVVTEVVVAVTFNHSICCLTCLFGKRLFCHLSERSADQMRVGGVR